MISIAESISSATTDRETNLSFSASLPFEQPQNFTVELPLLRVGDQRPIERRVQYPSPPCV